MAPQRASTAKRVRRAAWPRPFLALVVCALGVLSVPLLANGAAVSEHRVKAAFIYNFTKFVSWPAESFAGPNAPMVLGVFGESRVGTELQLLTKDRKVNGRDLIVKSVESADDTKGLHLLFVPAAEERRFAHIGTIDNESTLLIVTDAESCTQARASICFLQQGEQLRFTVAASVSKRSRLVISSHLQKLAANFKKP